MKVILHQHVCTVFKEPGDPIFSGVKNAAGESRLFHHLKNILNAHKAELGFEVIKKRMWKDGHMVDDRQQYLRVKKEKAHGFFCIYNTRWAIEGAEKALNETGKVCLQIEWADDTPQTKIDSFHRSFQKTYKDTGENKYGN